MQCPKCGFEQPASQLECLKCGVIFSRYRTRDEPSPVASSPPSDNASPASWRGLMRLLLLPPQTGVSAASLLARAGLSCLLLLWGGYFISKGIDNDALGQSFMHLIHLPFHEAGHLFFSPFGDLMMFLGGTLGQLLMPLICLLVFVFQQRDVHAASVCLWWLGQSFMDCSPYINDARDLKLTLIGGISAKASAGHDWENILSSLGWLTYDHRLAVAAFAIGTALMGLSFLWAGLIFRDAILVRRAARHGGQGL